MPHRVAELYRSITVTLEVSRIDDYKAQLGRLCNSKIRVTRNGHHCSYEEATVSKPSAIRENIFSQQLLHC